MEEDLRVAQAVKDMPFCLQFNSQLSVVIQLAVVRKPEPGPLRCATESIPTKRTLRGHWLMRLCRQINDRQATVGQADRSMLTLQQDFPTVIRAAIGDGLSHRREEISREV